MQFCLLHIPQGMQGPHTSQYQEQPQEDYQHHSDQEADIQDGVYFAKPSPRNSYSEEVTESGIRPLDRWLENGAGIPRNSTKAMDALSK